MGLLSVLRNLKKDDSEKRLLMLGLDNSGKTTALRSLAQESPEAVQSTTPTQGFNIKSVNVGGTKLNMWDIGGQKHIREYWKNYYPNTDAIIYIVDSSDTRRIDEAADELGTLLSEADLEGVPCLIFANKQDIMGAMSAADIMSEKGLDVNQYKKRWIQVKGCVAKTGEGLDEGIKLLLEAKAGS